MVMGSILAAGRRAYQAKIRPSTAMLIRGVIFIVDIDRNLSKIKEKTHTDHSEAVKGYETTINMYATP